ncbi:MAG TPA: hypothetical protein VLS51_01070 [Propionibacteriaceae bacterium]|nr:hypothetical protein [Propionibacteriaceae bacterium]
MAMPTPSTEGLADLDDLAAAVGTVHLVVRKPLFGCPAVWHQGGKPFLSLWGDDMVFRLAGAEVDAALALPGAATFEPRAGHPMTGWVRVSRTASEHWPDLAQKAAATPLT